MSSKAWRWTKRIALGLVAFVVVAIGVVLVVLHTDWGREIARKQVEARMNDMFVGGARIGSLEGSVLGDMVLRDIVINGPDEKPAVTVKKLTVGVGVLPLFSKQARIANLKAEDVDIDLRRDPDGTLQISRMVKPSPESGWAIQIPKLVVERAHVRVQGANGGEDTNLDGIHISGDVHMPMHEPLDANMLVAAHWRERDAPIWLDMVLRDEETVVTLASLIARVGEVRAVAAGVRVVKPAQATLAHPRPHLPVVSGLVSIAATTRALEQLIPNTDLPINSFQLSIIAAPQPLTPFTRISVYGTIDQTELRADIDADFDAKHARGYLATGTLDFTKLSRGRLEGAGATFITFDGVAGAATLPAGVAFIQAAGTIAGIPDAAAAIAVTSTGDRAIMAITAGGRDAEAQIAATVHVVGDAITLETSRVIARVRDPMRASGGQAPVHGAFEIDVSASGAVSPKPDLALAGHVTGSQFRVKDLTIRSLKVAIDARHLPSNPQGRGELKARGVASGSVLLRELDLNAQSRADKKIAVTMRSKPMTAPWLVEASAIVSLGDTIAIDLAHHRVRAGNGDDWSGDGGRITIGPREIQVSDIASASASGRLEVAGQMERASGDVKAHVDVKTFALSNLAPEYRGTIEGGIAIVRDGGNLASIVDLAATGVGLVPEAALFDATAHVEVGADKLLVEARATSEELGAIDFDLDIDAPKDITDLLAWKKLNRQTIRSARLQLRGLDVGKLVRLADLEGAYRGRIDGDIQISPTETGGHVFLEDVDGRALQNLGPVSADLALSQTAPDELAPTLVATIDDRRAAGAAVQKPLAKVEIRATLGMPDHLFDPAAWQRLGRGAVKSAALRIDDVMIDPALLDRLQVTTNLRGRASLVAEIGPAMASAKVQLDVKQLRGDPISQAVSLGLITEVDQTTTTITASIASTARLLDFKGSIPVGIDQLVANPSAIRTAAIRGTATFPDVPAPTLLAMFGRSQVIGGTITGTIDIAGTVEKPTLHARIAGTKLQVPPGPRNTPIKMIDHISIDGTWDGTTGTLAIDATQQKGVLQLQAQVDPRHLETGTASLVAKQFDLLPLLAFAPGPAGGAAGRLDAKLEVKSFDPMSMRVLGEAHIVDARIPIAPEVGTLRRAKIDVVISRNELKIGVDGRLGDGTVKAKARIGMDENAQPVAGDASITLRKVSPIGVVEPTIDADVIATVKRRPDAWVADIIVKHGVVKVPDARGEALDPVGMPDDMIWMSSKDDYLAAKAVDETRPARPTFIANIDLRSTYVESTEVRGYVHGKLTIESDAHTVGIVGKIEADRGDLDLFGRRYQLDRAVVRFDGSTDPLLDILITHDFAEVTTRTGIRGRLSKPELELSSDPGRFSQGQLLGFLLGGEPGGQPADGNPRDQATAAGASIIANKLGGYVKDALPLDIDVLRYEAATSTSSTAITVGTWISRKLFIAYRRRIQAHADENGGEGEVEYWLARRLVIEGVVGDRGYNGVDLLWRRRY